MAISRFEDRILPSSRPLSIRGGTTKVFCAKEGRHPILSPQAAASASDTDPVQKVLLLTFRECSVARVAKESFWVWTPFQQVFEAVDMSKVSENPEEDGHVACHCE